MSAAFTPGPWFAGRLVLADGDDDFGTISIGQQDLAERPNKDAHYEDTIAEVWQNPNLSEDAAANANLIAAAPDLYEACEAFVKAGNMSAFSAQANAAMAKAHDVAIAALAKARGEA